MIGGSESGKLLTDCSEERYRVEHPPGEGPLARAADVAVALEGPFLMTSAVLLLLEFLQVGGLAAKFLHEGLRQLVLIRRRRRRIRT